MTKDSSAIIAVVDDEASVRKALLRLLRSAGLKTQAFASGREFLNTLPSILYDCVVLDLHMSAMTGFDLQRDSIFIKARIPTVIITAYDEPGMREKCLSLGAAAYLCKPVDDKDLLSAIEAAIRGEPRSSGGASN